MARSKIIFWGLILILAVLIVWRYYKIELGSSPTGSPPYGVQKNYELGIYNDLDQEVVLIGKVVKEPDVRETNTKLTIKVSQIYPSLKTHDREFLAMTHKEKILVTVGRYPEYKYGDELEIIGKLETPTIFDDFNYRNYLKKDGIYSVIYYPKIELLKSYRGPSSVFSVIFNFKDKLRQGIYRFLSPPQSEILGAMILGDKNRMSQELKEKLNIAGVRHITAVSGLHVLILSGILMSLFLFLGFWRGQAFYISIIIIWLFIVLTGLQASGVRAGIMASLFLIGRKLGRQSFSSRSIIIAAGIMLVINPMLLFYDVGFQLSFLAASGIISLGSILKKWLKWDILVMTVSAYVFTPPILIYNFGQVSLIGLLANLLIVPVVYWIMILGFILVLISLFWSGLAWLLSIPVWLMLTYIIKLVDLFSQPWLAKNIENIHWFWLVLFYLFLTVFVYHLKSKEKLNKWT